MDESLSGLLNSRSFLSGNYGIFMDEKVAFARFFKLSDPWQKLNQSDRLHGFDLAY